MFGSRSPKKWPARFLSVVSIQWSVVDFMAANMKTRGYYFTMPGYSDDAQLQQLTTDNGQLTADQ